MKTIRKSKIRGEVGRAEEVIAGGIGGVQEKAGKTEEEEERRKRRSRR